MATRREGSMGETPRHRRTWHAARNLIALTTAFALIVAPLIVILTHGPAAHAAAASITTEIAAHGHDHSHGHTHNDAGRDGHDGPFGGHNPADHDHQLQALICQPSNTPTPAADKSRCAFNDVLRNLVPDGLMRPPRSV